MNIRQLLKKFFVPGLLFIGLLSLFGCQSGQSGITTPSAAGNSENLIQAALAQSSQSALETAIQDEYKARATYQKVLDTFGEVLPFSRIVMSESQHAQALTVLFDRYGVTVPEDTWYAQVPAFASVQDACAAAVQAEVENVALYDQLLAQVTEPDIIQVFTRLSWVSQNIHLPAFEQCAQGTYTPGTGTSCAPGSGCGAGSGYGFGSGQGAGSGNGASFGQGAGFGPRW